MATPIIGSLLYPNTDPLATQGSVQTTDKANNPITPLSSTQTTANNPITPLEPIGSTQAKVTNMTATPAQTRDVTAVNRTVDKPTETVQGQLGSFLSSGSPILERAMARSDQEANKRGLRNSSIAIGAGQAAVIDAATPIATSDANIYNQAAGQNLQYQNQAASQNSQQGTQINQSNATEQNRSSAQNAQLSSQIAQSNAENNVKMIIDKANNATKIAMTNLESQNKNLLQTNASASDLYKQSQSAISQIIMNKDLDAPAKNAAISQQLKLLQSGMSLIGNITGLTFNDANGNKIGMDKLLDFGGGGNSGGGVTTSGQFATAQKAVADAQAALNAANNNREGSRRIRAERQNITRAALTKAQSEYEQVAGQQNNLTP